MNQITCREALLRLYEYLDRELADASEVDIRQHLERCQQCFPELQFARSFQDVLRRAAQGQTCAPSALRHKIAELLRAEEQRGRAP